MRLSHLHRMLLLCAFSLLPLMAWGDAHPWLPVDPGALQMKELKQIPGAEAALLYYADEIDDTNHTEFFYSRIKILGEGGKRFANVEIPMLEKTSVEDLLTRIIHADGKIVDMTLRPYEKMI